MSRSYKKQPFMAITGNRSAKQDKRMANRGVRRAHKRALRTQDFENFLLPHRYECHWNEVYSWSRDGNQMYQGLTARDWYRHVEALDDIAQGKQDWWSTRFAAWPPFWYAEMMRK